MKKSILMLALIVGACVFVNANTSYPVLESEPVCQSVTEDGYKEVKLEDLSETLQAAIKAFEENYTVKAIAANAEKKLTKVTLVSNEDESEKVVLLNEEGKEVTEDKQAE